jgi:hypothetical protein
MPTVFDGIFARASEANRLALGMYLIPGFPNWEDSRLASEYAAAAGVDFIEFPVVGTGGFTARTGSTIARILDAGAGVADDNLLAWLAPVRTGVGVIYEGAWPEAQNWNAHEALLHHSQAFLMEADVPDIEEWAGASQRNWGKPIVTTVDACREMLSPLEQRRISRSSAFIYMSLGSKTGERRCDTSMMRRKLLQIRALGCRTPVCAAFGISTPEDIWAVREAGCDGVIIGSAALEALEHGAKSFARWLEEIVSACTADHQFVNAT